MERETITQQTSPFEYFHILPNMADDDLDPYEYRLFGHYVRVCGARGGTCTQGVRRIASMTQMSMGKVVEARRGLVAKGYVHAVLPEDNSSTVQVTLLDRWAENIARYKKGAVQDMNTCSPGEHPVHTVNAPRSPGEQKNNPSKKNLIKKNEVPASASQPAPAGLDIQVIVPNGLSSLELSLLADRIADSTNDSPATTDFEAAVGFQDPGSAWTDANGAAGAANGGAKNRSPRQQANDKANEQKLLALEEAWRIKASKPDIPLYLKVANALLAGGVPCSEFRQYVERLRDKARRSGWTLTLPALIGNGRISEYVAARDSYHAQKQDAETITLPPGYVLPGIDDD